MVLILVPKETNRLRYAMQLMLTRLLGITIEYTVDISTFENYTGAKFSYSVKVDGKYLFFASNPLLFESKISAIELKHFVFKEGIVFFPTHDTQSALPFDLFAACFYLTSRYEEYLPHIRDEHNRFLASGSDAFQKNYLQKPVVNTWSLILKEVLQTRFPDLGFRLPSYEFAPTIDVDAAYAYKNKGLTRAIGGIFKALQKKDFNNVKQRVRVLVGLEHDPFDTFELQMSLQQKYKYRSTYFILLADYGPNDKNIPHNNRYFRALIRILADYSEIGIHPSYASSIQPSLISTEISRLTKILKREVGHSRQHFLKLTLPDTYRNLINNDITHDYSMGYAEVSGFRASICTPFPFYDLDQDLPTDLILHPFTVMDGTLNQYMKLTPEQATQKIDELITEVKKVGGAFMPLWHNSTLTNEDEWKGWLDVYIKMVEKAVWES
ncbi:MAG: polysaccharide deacetylase family protein [Bacteroidales bacterium]